jgi:hypothetical protein
MNKRVAIALFSLAACVGSLTYGGKAFIDKLESQYYLVLDGWVNRGGKAQEYQDDVVWTCGKLVMVEASASELVSFWTAQKGEFDFRVNICAKTTVHRVHRQPELNDQDLVQNICDDASVPMFEKLCRRSGLR